MKAINVDVLCETRKKKIVELENSCVKIKNCDAERGKCCQK